MEGFPELANQVVVQVEIHWNEAHLEDLGEEPIDKTAAKEKPEQ